ncbi:MAG: hypothetical protein PHC88_07690 [Terrimicrobiaceae bacterium]|nr:hypothetical protein [Terrimicrobiaceae bacterium]
MKAFLCSLLATACTALSIAASLAQTPPIQIESFQVERATLPGTQRPWTKLTCTINNRGTWADGLSFNYTVLAELGGSAKSRNVLTGGATYINVPSGKSQAVMYLSPNAVARFGEPVAASVQLDRGERTIQTFNWTGKSSPEADWASKYPTQNGALLNVRATPWSLLDSERGGDLIVN